MLINGTGCVIQAILESSATSRATFDRFDQDRFMWGLHSHQTKQLSDVLLLLVALLLLLQR